MFGTPAAGVEVRAGVAARDPRSEPGARRRAVHRLRGRGAHVRGALPSGRAPRDDPRRALRRREGRPRRDRDAQLPGVVDRVLGRGRGRRDRRAAQRVVDRRRAGVRPAATPAPKVVFVDAERLERLADVLPALDVTTVVARAEADATGAVERWEDVLGEVPDRRRAARRRPRTRRPRDDLLHVGHHRPAEGRARHASQHLRQPASRSRSRRGARRCAPGKEPAPTSGQNVYLLSVPFFHATGCHSVLVANLAAGGKLVLMHKWDAERALELIERERVTTFGGVPAMVWQVLQSPSFESRDISSVQSIGYGGAPAAPELVRRIEQLFPGPHAVERLRPDRDVVGHDDELRRRLPAQARQRRRAGAGRRRAGRRRRRQRRCRSARSASCGSRARTS